MFRRAHHCLCYAFARDPAERCKKARQRGDVAVPLPPLRARNGAADVVEEATHPE